MDRADHCEAMLSMTGAGARRPGSIPGPVCTVPGAARDRCTLSSSPREPPFCSRCAEAMQSCNQTIAQTNEKHDRTRSRLSSGNEAHGSFPMANDLGAFGVSSFVSVCARTAPRVPRSTAALGSRARAEVARITATRNLEALRGLIRFSLYQTSPPRYLRISPASGS